MNLSSLSQQLISSPWCQHLFNRFQLSSERAQQLGAFGFLACIVLVLMITAAFSVTNIVGEEEVVAEEGTFSYFDLHDAEAYCEKEMEARLGKSLLRSHVDSHSSRLDSGRGIFRVYLKADVGDLHLYDEISIHCFVDQWDKDLAHYREYNPNVKVVKSSDIKFFSH